MAARIRNGRLPRERGTKRNARIYLTIAALLLANAAAFLAYFLYWNWRAEKAAVKAYASLNRGDPQGEILSLRNVLRHSPGHLGANTALAFLLERTNSSEALLYWRKLMELQPLLLEPKLAYARSALQFGKTAEAKKVLDSIRGLNRKSTDFLELRARLFIARGKSEAAADVYRELLELHPENQRVQITLSALEIESGSDQARDSARLELQSLSPDAGLRLIALRALAEDALRRQDFPTALSWSRRISEEPSIEFSDKILHLRALNAARSPDYDRWLSQLERSGFETPQFAIELAKWKLSALGPQSAADWLERAPDQVRRQPSVNLLLAECYSALGRWADLETLTNSGPWRDYEVLCLAYLARGQAGQGNLAGSEQTWNLALAAAEKQPEQLDLLLAVARADKKNVRQILWMMAKRDPGQVSARQELYQAYWQERDADGMLRMMELVLSENPNDRSARYNVASLLMATGRQIARAARLAKGLYEENPEALGNAALYALALSLQGDPKRAADLLESRADLDQLGADGSAYYALVLSAGGRNAEAREVLARVDREALLPELRASLDRVLGAPGPSLPR